MSTYMTIQGDTWDMIAYKLYGDETRMSDLISANQTHASTVVFSGGIRLTAPSIEAQTSPSNLPPWKRGAPS